MHHKIQSLRWCALSPLGVGSRRLICTTSAVSFDAAHTRKLFLKALRAHDVRVSPAEAIDAHRAAAEVGYGDRALLRDALCVTLAKSGAEVDRFDACFDTFFARPTGAPLARRAARRGPAKRRPGRCQPAGQLLSGDDAALAQAMEAAAAGVGAGRYPPDQPTQSADPPDARRPWACASWKR